ncbi:acetylcholinesterase [Patella vulgata]|uniref:acetylcholinesterase n=1 Tax=Patella vulgata TaxID=6465 RepID=UPI00217F810B|nr:acetylcholinesterase [Patella vulgata]
MEIVNSERRHVLRKTKYGKVRGEIETLSNGKRIDRFLGIPYAKPPVGELRFEPPEPPEAWEDEVLNAYDLPPACAQPEMGVNYIGYYVPGFNTTSEDCLYLNIYTPKKHNHFKGSYPVLVFVHGGSYHNGMGAMLEGGYLASYDVIVITFNYRLGPLGFLTSYDKELPGNYGMLDQIQALKWVQENIHNFGGDPNRVTIDGHSAGGCSVGLLMLSPMAKGLFQNVIQQSGSPFAHWAVHHRHKSLGFYTKMFMASVGCLMNSSKEIKECMKTVSKEKMEKVIRDNEMPVPLDPVFRPVVDGLFLPDVPEKLVKTGKINGKNFLTGATRDEGLTAASSRVKMFAVGQQQLIGLVNCFSGDLPKIEGIMETVMEQYSQWPIEVTEEQLMFRFSEIVGDYFIVAPTYKAASILSKSNVTVYVYNYEYKSIWGQWKGVVHGAEMFYLSGYPIRSHQNFRYDGMDKEMSRQLMKIWANFVKSGTPSLLPESDFHMARYTDQYPLYTRFYSAEDGPYISTETNFKTAKLSFWNEKVPQLYKAQYEHMFNISVDTRCTRSGRYVTYHNSNSWILIAVCIGLSVITVLLSVCYCQMRRQVSVLIRQSSVSSGERML